ncbi:sporulation protein YtxC [Paenibacillus thermoaerophilus]|uniref:Sporulation protein YtxC n=1 Tax=Paenibacillus thermoaerophilus TaxID=1215385 RepID=A0ABW2V590_9BACL|nr:putative sporulation protein YtxC [Paenibacillus thermoaerophilus]
MQLFRITTHELAEAQMQSLMERIRGKLESLEDASAAVELSLETGTEGISLLCTGMMPRFELSRAEPVWRLSARAFAEFVVDELEPAIVEDIVSDTCRDDEREAPDREELDGVMAYCGGLLNRSGGAGSTAEPWKADASHDTERRIQMVARTAEAYLERETLLIVEGFVRFRLHDYLNELFETVDSAYEEYWSDRQYREFIALLKYFVYIQDTRIPMAHLLHRSGGEFTLLDERLQPLDPGQFDQVTLEVQDMNIQFEDMIVSALLSVAPQQIALHTRTPDDHVVQTILNIFEPRAKVCTGCPACQGRLGPPPGEAAGSVPNGAAGGKPT